MSTQLIGLSLTIALPLAALFGYNLHRSDERDKRELGTVALRLADSAAKNAEFLLADARRALTVLAQRPALLALDRNACDPLLGDIQKLQPVYRNARTVNRDGVLICSALAPVSAAAAGPDLVSWFGQVRDSMQFTIGTPALGVISKRWEVTLAYPMRGAQGEFIGAVALSLDLDDYPLMPASTPLPRGAVAGIASYAGVVIARSTEAGRPVGSSTLQSKLRAAALAAESGQLEIVGTDAIPRIYAFTPIPRSGWYAVAGISAADVYAESRARLLQSLLLILAVLLLASAGAFAVARRIEQPLRRLADAAGAVAAGDRVARAPLGGSREAVALGSRFNAMLDALDASERQFRETMGNVHLVAVALDERGNVTYCNDFTVELSGWRREELLGRNWFDTVLPDPEPVRMVFERAMVDGNLPQHYENEIITRGGERRLIHWSNTILRDAAARILGTVSLGEDVTERKRAEEELLKYRDHLEELVKERTTELNEANLRLQELDRLKSMFIASMSHELRTPLNSIIGFTGIILMGMSGEISAVQKKQLGMVKNSANHLLDLINDVIDVSKIETGKTDLSIEAFDLSDLALEVKESFTVAASEKGLNLEWGTDGGAEVTSDRRRVRQILVNLVGNAVKFTETGTVAISVLKTGKGVEIKVSDTGIGMHREDMERLFQAFSRIHFQDRPVVEGAGLGLYLSRRIAALLGGEITAESEPGRGSEFTLSLPRTFQEEKG